MRSNLNTILLIFGLSSNLVWAGSFESVQARDTVTVVPDDSVFFLTQSPVISHSLQLFSSGRWIENYSLNSLTGRIVLKTTSRDTVQYISTYSYLSPGLPLTVGPQYLQLPLISEITNPSEVKPVQQVSPATKPKQDELFTAGSIYRRVELSPFGGTDFNGGLRLQLQGKLADDIQVSGVLADENLPIQPEGNTQTLEEIDQVYLMVKHPAWGVTAGDIDFSLNRGKFLKINRRLVGLKGNLGLTGSSGQAVYAAAKGNYRVMTIKGTEGSQGPYSLISATGSRNIIVIAGSERIYIDGNILTRGENNDYIIDYSTGEITFTAQQLIHGDSDILIEYQYSDFRYNRNLIGASWQITAIEHAEMTVTYLSEQDNITVSQLNLSSAARDSLASAGDQDVYISGAIADSLGDYYLDDGIYIYRVTIEPDSTLERYNVFFQNDVSTGTYIRKVAANGQLYYAYVPETERQRYQDLYSPIQHLDRPERQQAIQFTAAYRPSKRFGINTELSLSEFDLNRLSARDDDDNLGLAYNFELNGNDLALTPLWNLSYHLSNWGKAERFHSLQRDQEALFDRDWNLLANQIGNQNMVTAGFGLNHTSAFNLNVDWSQYQVREQNKNRYLIESAGSTNWIPQYSGRISRMESATEYLLQSQAQILLLPGKLHPYYDYSGELNRTITQFEHHTVGLDFDGETGQGKLGIGRRIDWAETDTSLQGLERISRGYFGLVDVNVRSLQGWNYKITFSKRIKTEFLDSRKFDFELLQTNFSYFNNLKPLRWDMKTKLEETYTENRAIVYDSVGTGLGNYRYDQQFNEYIADPNGSYIAYNILTGDRHPTTRFDGIQRIQLNFNKTRLKRLKGLIARLELRADFRGNRFGTMRLFKPTLLDSGITRAQWNNYNEIDYRPVRRGRRLRVWNRNVHDLNGLDPRGSDLKRAWETGLEFNETLHRNFLGIIIWRFDELSVNSALSNLRNRTVAGYWLEGGVKWHPDHDWQCETTVQLGRNAGDHHAQDYQAEAYGIKLDVLRFIGQKGRLQSRLEWFRVGSTGSTALPPEALNGLPVGHSLRINMTGQFLIGSNLSVNLNCNYIADSRYDRLITLTGELRAFF